MLLDNKYVKQCIGEELFIDDEKFELLNALAESVKRWNGLNLVAKSTESDMYKWHIFDALSIFGLIKRANAECLIDFGAGSGILGASLKIMGISDVVFIERSETKLNFIKDVLGLSAFASIDHFNKTLRDIP